MSDKNDSFETAVIDYFLRPGATAPARPTTIYVGLATAAANTETPSFTEASYAGYARVAVTFGAPSGGVTSNTNEVLHAAVAGSTLNVSHFVISDAASGAGTVVHMVKAVTGGPVSIAVGDVPRWAVGAITHTET